ADVEIAKVCGPGDAVASRDGDFFAYQQVQTIWRVVGFGARANVHCYHVQEVLLSLGLTRDQLTALCVVTGNDYNKNISTLGICTNYELIKDITAGQDVAAIVSDYLGLESVMLKNAALTTFDDSLRVFIGLTQTPITTPGGQQTDSSDHYHRLLKEFDDARLQLKERQKTMAAEKRHQKLRHNSIPNTSNHSSIDPPITEHRPRYSFKTRQTAKLHERPQTLLQYKWKESKSLVPDQIPAAPVQDIPDMAAKRRKMIEGRRTDKLTATSNKKMILTALEYEHPFAVLRLGLLEGNVKKALPNQPDAAQEMVGCLRAAVCDAWSIKRRCQEIISIYLAKVSSFSVVSEKDRQILDQLCPRLTKDDFKQPGDGTVDESSNKDAGTGDSADKNANFLHSFMSALHSGNRPGSKALLLVERLRDKEFEGILQPFEIGLPGTVNQNDDRFPASSLTRSVSGQMYVELKKHFKHGTVNLYHKLEVIQKRDPSSPTVPINYNLSAVENFWRLNKLLHNPWKPFPLSSVEVGFVTFTEYELGGFFFNSRYPCLRTKLRQDMKEAFPRTPEESLNKTTLVEDHLPKTRFGHLTEMLVAKVGSDGLTRRQRDRAGLEAAIDNLSLDDIKRHINELREEDFDPRAYKGKGYIMRGSIKTDGHELQLLVHKKKELLGVRYKRFPDDRLPNRLLSTMGGADYYLTEVRNVFKSAQDVQDLLGCSPDQVRQEVTVLGIDLGQAFVVGASAVRPGPPIQRRNNSNDGQKRKRGRKGKRGGKLRHKQTHKRGKRRRSITKEQATEVDKGLPLEMYYNLAVKQKAVYQPTLKHRRWMEGEKRKDLNMPEDLLAANVQVGPGEEATTTATMTATTTTPTTTAHSPLRSISDIESSLPPLRGEDTDVNKYLDHLHKYEKQLNNFYNSYDGKASLKKNKWFSKRAREREYWLIADRLLEMVDGCMGARRHDKNKVVIGIGLGEFSGVNKLSSLHGTFETYFIQKVRALGYLVVGVNEFYSSKKCPTCHKFVAQTESIRRLWCDNCKKPMHRDVMAGHNMCNAILGHLEDQQRPLYLQPVTADGLYPWMQQGEKEEPSNKAPTNQTPETPKTKSAGKKRKTPSDGADTVKETPKKKSAGKKRKAPSDDTDS
ncbi:hypothetical protein BGZ58_009995, partial [Dissophora ornata]